ncbi:efflux RND transporter periplasmic adaptor subunit [Rhizobium sp. PL01]|uniref:efflux RND transporter periplasmic adaptor subunit n=1 Tax=Rhizobium sp. PL01 TaxID=3085631 RepID=UPI002980CE61|nr:efflux RND transporter periplasmic adaptor subunit [Rhizobium sp. PL01]MDW5317649.1 efflux RND transporter periplasmic adaptor subunit [Rhizobium sp. PL01]
MSTSRIIATLSLAAIVGGGGYWAGKNDVGAYLQRYVKGTGMAAEAEPRREGTGAVIYYRHPDGAAEYSAKPANTDDGRPFTPVRGSEEISLGATGSVAPEAGTAAVTPERKVLYYRNPMGLPDTSKVPKKDSMGMDYLPVYDGEVSDSSTVEVTLGKLQRTGVKTALAEKMSVSRKIRVPGTVTLDERMVSIVSMRADAFVEEVSDVTTGDRIAKGEDLFHFYSKEIATAGAEYATEMRNGGKLGPYTGSALRLKNLGVPTATITSIATERKVPQSIAYTSPRDGVVLERMAVSGMMAEAGDILFRIADISKVWVIADVPEYELASVRKGAIVSVAVRNLPGTTFKGTVDLIYPEIQMQTRTTKVRIELPNPDGQLMSNMYAEVEIEAGAGNPVVAVPNSSVIDTGDRQIVFLDKGEGRFEPIDVGLGVRGEDMTEITKGIATGDRVVVSANFLLDAESNLNAALSALTTDEVKP